MFNDKEPKQPPPHIFTKVEEETQELIDALLENGWKVIEWNQWVNDFQKRSYYRTELQNGNQSHIFEMEIPLGTPPSQRES